MVVARYGGLVLCGMAAAAILLLPVLLFAAASIGGAGIGEELAAGGKCYTSDQSSIPAGCHCGDGCSCCGGDCRCEKCPADCWRITKPGEHPPATINDPKARHALWSWRTNDRGDWAWICTGGPHGNWKAPVYLRWREIVRPAAPDQPYDVMTNADGEWLFLVVRPEA